MSSALSIKRTARLALVKRAGMKDPQPAGLAPVGSTEAAGRLGLLRGTASALALVAVFTGLPVQAKERFEIIDSKVWATGVSLIPPHWIDSRQVLFLTGPDFKRNEHLLSLAIWDIGGMARMYRANVMHYCYRGGFIVYKVVDVEDPRLARGTWFAGTLGHEEQIRKDREGDIARIHDPINCKIASDDEVMSVSKQTNLRTVALLQGHGHLELGAAFGPDSTKNTPIKHVPANSDKPTVLLLGRSEVFRPKTYFPFASAYLFENVHFGKRRQTNSERTANKDLRIAWTLSMKGGLTEHIVQDGPWAGGPVPASFFSRLGLGFINHGGIYDRTDGIYLVVNGKVQRLVGGRVATVGVSAEGCMLAFSHAPSAEADRAPGQKLRTLKAVNLCKQRR